LHHRFPPFRTERGKVGHPFLISELDLRVGSWLHERGRLRLHWSWALPNFGVGFEEAPGFAVGFPAGALAVVAGVETQALVGGEGFS
jgi:hypothetical protein